jgi:hypothetical protein
MDSREFLRQLEHRIAMYGLLCHPLTGGRLKGFRQGWEVQRDLLAPFLRWFEATLEAEAAFLILVVGWIRRLYQHGEGHSHRSAG